MTGGIASGVPDAASWDLIGFRSIAELSQLLRRAEVSAAELAEAALRALDGHGREYNAVVALAPGPAAAQARSADERLRRGDAMPLTGIPYAVKDMFATRGLPTTWGSPAHGDQHLDAEAAVVTRLKEADAVLTAKLSLVSLAGAGSYRYASASATGHGLNPWNRAHWAGGSSSGSGAAVAAGLVPFALGSETGGSTVIPASFCGVTGLRPSYGRVSKFGMMPVAATMDKVGILARSAADCEAVLRTLAGRDLRDPATAELRWSERPARSCRIGVLPSDFDRFPDTGRVFETALETLAELGLAQRRVELPARALRPLYERILTAECAVAHAEFIASDGLQLLSDEVQRAGLRACAEQPAAAYVAAQEERMAAAFELRALFDSVDVLVAPTVMTEAPPLDADLEEWRAIGQYAILGAIAGLPGISVPMGFGQGGLPLGLGFIGDVGAELTVLGVARAFQDVTDWHARRPG